MKLYYVPVGQGVHTFLSFMNMIANINMNLKNNLLDNILWIQHNYKCTVCSVVYFHEVEILHFVANNYGLVIHIVYVLHNLIIISVVLFQFLFIHVILIQAKIHGNINTRKKNSRYSIMIVIAVNLIFTP